MYVKNDKTCIFLTKDKHLNDLPILFLHGFTGSSKSWDETRNNLNHSSIALDIPGHGKSTFNNLDKEYTYKNLRSEIYLCLKKLNVSKVHLCGYSMGGRIAISLAQKYPSLIKSLILESSSLGISNSEEKNKRFEEDLTLSNNIINSIDDFNKTWTKNKLFKHQKTRNNAAFIKQNLIRKSHNSNQLSKSLLSFSKGTMPAFEESFALFDFPVYLINGHDDTKYIKINRDMMKIHKKSKQFIINNASHNVHLENNEFYIDTLYKILIDVT